MDDDEEDSGLGDPRDPEWEKPSLEEVEQQLDEVEEVLEEAEEDRRKQADLVQIEDATDPDRPNVAKGPETVDAVEDEAYIVAIEMCMRLPDDIRLPEEAAETVPVVVEASLRRRVEAFVGEEFGTDDPRVDRLEFEETGDGIWVKLRVGVDPEAFDDLAANLDRVRRVALQSLQARFEETSFRDA